VRCPTCSPSGSPPPTATPTWVPLAASDPLVGYVNTDDLQQLHRDELHDLLGSLSPTTLRAVNDALRIVLALP